MPIWNVAAALADGFVDVVQEKVGAAHDAASEDDGIGGEEVDEVGEAEAEIVGFAVDALAG